MSVSLVFKRNDEALRLQLDRDLLREPGVAFEEELFEQAVYLEIGGTVLLRGQPLPVLYIAVQGLEILKRLRPESEERLLLPGAGSLRFWTAGDHVVVEHTGRGRARAKYDDVFEAWQQFYLEAKALVMEVAPQAAKHPVVSGWMHRCDD